MLMNCTSLQVSLYSTSSCCSLDGSGCALRRTAVDLRLEALEKVPGLCACSVEVVPGLLAELGLSRCGLDERVSIQI